MPWPVMIIQIIQMMPHRQKLKTPFIRMIQFTRMFHRMQLLQISYLMV